MPQNSGISQCHLERELGIVSFFDYFFISCHVFALKGQVHPIGTVALLIALSYKNTMLFTQTQTDPVNRRYDPICMAKLLGGQNVGIVHPKCVTFRANNT